MKINKLNNSEKINMNEKFNKNQPESNKNQYKKVFGNNSYKEDMISEHQNLVYSKETLKELKLHSKNIYNETIKIIEDEIINQIEEVEKLTSLHFPKMVEDIVGQASGELHDEIIENIIRLFEIGDFEKIEPNIREKIIVGIRGNLTDIIEEFSERIFGVIKENSQGKVGEVIALKEALYIAFKNTEENLDGLPETTIETYKRALDKLSDYEFLEAVKASPEKGEFFLRAVIKDTVVRQLSDNKTLSDSDISKINKEILENLYTSERGKIYSKISFKSLNHKSIINIIINNEDLEIESASERILSFIENIARGDKREFNSMIKLVERSLFEIEKSLGILPKLTKDTYKRIIEKSKTKYYKYNYLIPLLRLDEFRLKKGLEKEKESSSLPYIIIILLGIFVYYALKSSL